MGIGFNNLVVGNEYELRFNLYEGSIFNEVKDLSADKFYLLDKETQKVSEISSANSYKFVVSNSIRNYLKRINYKNLLHLFTSLHQILITNRIELNNGKTKNFYQFNFLRLETS